MRTPAYGALVGEDDFFKVVVDPISKVLTWVGGVRLHPDVLYRNLEDQLSLRRH